MGFKPLGVFTPRGCCSRGNRRHRLELSPHRRNRCWEVVPALWRPPRVIAWAPRRAAWAALYSREYLEVRYCCFSSNGLWHQHTTKYAVSDRCVLFRLSGTPASYMLAPAYYDQNGQLVMGNGRGMGTPVRLVSPAPILVNAGQQGKNWQNVCFIRFLCK